MEAWRTRKKLSRSANAQTLSGVVTIPWPQNHQKSIIFHQF
jgi:hypothetical protein